jgi:hypothetical protein
VKHLDAQAVMNTHLSQPTGAGAFDGQHGISLAISSTITDGDISSAIACIEASPDNVPAMTDWETGANARLAIINIASRRRMAELRFTPEKSQKVVKKKSPSYLAAAISAASGHG